MEEIISSIDWINYPDILGITILCAALFCNNTVVGVSFMYGVNNGLFSFDINFTDIFFTVLIRNVDAVKLIQMAYNDLAS